MSRLKVDRFVHPLTFCTTATTAFFFDRPRPERIRLHLIRDEVVSVE